MRHLRFRTLLLPIAAAVLALSFANISAAQTGVGKSKILPLRVSSNKLAPAELQKLTDSILAKLKRYPTIEVLPVPTSDPMDMIIDAGCTDFDDECLAGIGASSGADRVLFTEVADKDGRFQIQIRMVDVKTKQSKSPQGGTETREKLADFMGVALEGVVGPEPVKAPVLTTVEINSNPPGSEVYVDKDFVGLAPVTVRLKAGAHALRIVKIGYKEVAIDLPVEDGKPLARAFNLVAVEVAKPVGPVPVKEREVAAPTPFYKTWWFWTAVGVVVVGGGTTAYLLARNADSTSTGTAVFAADPYYAPRDVTLFK